MSSQASCFSTMNGCSYTYILEATNIGDRPNRVEAIFPTSEEAAVAAWKIYHEYGLEKHHNDWYVLSTPPPSASTQASESETVAIISAQIEMTPLYAITISYDSWDWNPKEEFQKYVRASLTSEHGSFVLVGSSGGGSRRPNNASAIQGRLEITRYIDTANVSCTANRGMKIGGQLPSSPTSASSGGSNKDSSRRSSRKPPRQQRLSQSSHVPRYKTPTRAISPSSRTATTVTSYTTKSTKSKGSPNSAASGKSQSANGPSSTPKQVVVFLDKEELNATSRDSKKGAHNISRNNNDDHRSKSRIRPLDIRTEEPSYVSFPQNSCEHSDDEDGPTSRDYTIRFEKKPPLGLEDDDHFSKDSTVTTPLSVFESIEKTDIDDDDSICSSQQQHPKGASRGFLWEEGIMRLFGCGAVCHSIYGTCIEQQEADQKQKLVTFQFKTAI